ncbi:MAG TPA: PfkB family carbohydrate kinase [Actinomycetota bacterium]
MRTAVIGHVEWVEFAHVERVPRPGEIVHAEESWQAPAGGGGVAAVQLAKLAGNATLFTALGDDRLGEASRRGLEKLGVRVEAVFRPIPQRRCFTYIDGRGERTITTIGGRLNPSGEDPLPWDELATTGAVYFTAGDRGALEAGRRAGALVATSRVVDDLARAGVRLDALVGSAFDPAEVYRTGDLNPPPRLVVRTEGKEGGTYKTDDGRSGRFAAAPVPGPMVDTYGAGDSFAAGLTFALGAGYGVENALELAARCGAACLTGRGPYEGQLHL